MIKVTDENGQRILVNPHFVGFIFGKTSPQYKCSSEYKEHPHCNSVLWYESNKIFVRETVNELAEMGFAFVVEGTDAN